MQCIMTIVRIMSRPLELRALGREVYPRATRFSVAGRKAKLYKLNNESFKPQERAGAKATIARIRIMSAPRRALGDTLGFAQSVKTSRGAKATIARIIEGLRG